MKKSVFLIFASMLITGTVCARTVKVGELYYNLNEKDYVAKVTRDRTNNCYREIGDNIIIPPTIKYNQKEYEVIGIEQYVFSFSYKKNVSIPYSVVSIDDEAFGEYGVTSSINVDSNNDVYCSINGVLFNKNKTTLIKYPSRNNKGHYDIPNSVIKIADGAFLSSGLSSITIPYSVKYIGREAFKNNWFSTLMIPSTVSVIGERAFESNSDLTSVQLSEGVTSITDSVFFGCLELRSIMIPSTVEFIGKDAFSVCVELVAINVQSNNRYFSSIDGVLFNKDKSILIKYPEGKGGMSYAIPNTVRHISEGAFIRNKFTSIAIPNSVETIGDNAFDTDYIEIDDEEFEEDEACPLKTLYIGTGLRKIGDNAFASCGLTSIQVSLDNPYFVTQDGVLYNKNKSKLLLYPSGKKNEYFTVPSTVTCIASRAFCRCKLSDLVIPNSVQTLEEIAMIDCIIGSLNIGSGLKNIDSWAFGGSMFNTISVSPDNPYFVTINDVLFDISKTRLILYPSAKTAKKYVIPNTVKIISSAAFYGSTLSTITLGTNIRHIEEDAFVDCYVGEDERRVICRATTPPTCGEIVFNDDYPGVDVLYVPQESIMAYKKSKFGKLFEVIRPIPVK